MNVYIPSTWFATQWPCDDWFHVPLLDEWSWLKTVMDWLSITTSWEWKAKLHLPFAWLRGNTGVISGQNESWQYWSSSPQPWYNDYAYREILNSSWVTPDATIFRSWALSIRPFKNKFVVPTSWWTVITWTLGWAWIFWNTTDWIISITSDWSTWYTISDKNCWATVVYNDWDTLSESNCGKYYQWGNNYWFAFTWSIPASSAKVNAENYWPWNYYSSSTFIMAYSSPYSWDSSNNNNLRWWEDGNVQVVNELKNAYIGEVYEYSYDFRNKSEWDITNAGWVKVFWTFATGSSWISSPVGKDINIRYPVDLSTANVITIQASITYNNSRDGQAFDFWLYESTTSAVTNLWFFLRSTGSYGWTRVVFENNWTMTSWTNVWAIGTSSYTPKLVIDLVNKTATWSIAWYSDSTYSLSDAQVTLVRSLWAIWLYTTQGNFYCQNVSVTIE